MPTPRETILAALHAPLSARIARMVPSGARFAFAFGLSPRVRRAW